MARIRAQFSRPREASFINFREKGEELRYFVCLDGPTFHNYTKQNNAIQRKSFAFEQLSYMNVADRELCKILINHMFKLKDVFINMTITQDTSESTIPDLGNELQSTPDALVITPQRITAVVLPPIVSPHPTAIPTPSPITPTHSGVNLLCSSTLSLQLGSIVLMMD